MEVLFATSYQTYRTKLAKCKELTTAREEQQMQNQRQALRHLPDLEGDVREHYVFNDQDDNGQDEDEEHYNDE